MNTVSLPLSAQIHARLVERLLPTELRVTDESAQHAGHVGANDSGLGTHMRVCIASPLFAGLGRVQRHRLVYDALQAFIDQGLHALALELI